MTANVTIQTNDYSFRRYQKHTHLRSRYRKTCIDDNTYRTLPICDFRLLWSDPHASCYGQENEATASLVAKGTHAFFCFGFTLSRDVKEALAVEAETHSGLF